MTFFPLRTVRAVLTTALALCGSSSFAQGLPLQLQRSLGPAPEGEDLPIFVVADRLEGLTEGELEASGNAEVRKGGMTLYADHIRYWQATDEAEAQGNVLLMNRGNEVRGPRMRMRIGDHVGIFENPVFKLAPREVVSDEGGRGQIAIEKPATQIIQSRGDAKAVRFEGPDHYRMTEGRITSCRPDQDDWYVNADELHIDMSREVAVARNFSLSFLGATTPEIPWFEFPLNNNRKTGFLPPTLGASGDSGPEVAVPFYWNIAPNYDATFTPRFMEKRGVQLLSEFRYLQPYHNGVARYEVLPEDEEEGSDRWGLLLQHATNFRNGWSGAVNINKVSDDDYFRDLSSRLSVATQTHLPREGYIQYAGSNWWTARARIQKFQTLQDPFNPIAEPYEREPQILFTALNQDNRFVDLGTTGEFVSFTHPDSNVDEGRRTILYPSIAFPFNGTSGYIKPKAGVHSTWYNLSDVPGTEDRTPSRFVPIFSVDSSVVFERDTAWLGRDWVQTLEPRLYYLRVPHREQNDLPVFDTSLADLSFGQIFSENIFVGGDRIAEANQLTAAVTSRLIDPTTGQELIRGLVGQRYYFDDQRVALTDGSGQRSSSESSILAALSGRLARDWHVDSGIQYDAGQKEVERFNTGVRYSPAPASIANVSYRYTNESQTTIGAIESIDVSGQWPLAKGWYGMARLNYDIDGDKLAERLAGIEYNAGCWIMRVVYHHFQTSSRQETNLFFIQLELNGFSRFGSNPLEALRRGIPGYTQSNYVDPNQGNVFDRSEVISPWSSVGPDGY
jgi:LPS-assembly protein